MRKTHQAALFAVWLLFAANAVFAIAGKDVLAALDNPSGVEFVKFEYCVQKLDADGFPMFNDDTGEPVYATKPTAATTSTWWAVQSSLDKKTYPQTTKCLRSTNTAKMSSARIYLRVFGPGTFALKYKTSTEMGDCLNVYVDGEEVMSTAGYDIGYTPAQAGASAGDSDWYEEIFRIESGMAEQGSQAGTYWHEIMIEYAKDEWEPDGPVKPTLAGCNYDREWYNEELADYNATKPYYNDCVWIDAGFIPLEEDENFEVTRWGTTWVQDAPELTVDYGYDLVFVDSYEVNFFTNVYDFGYTVRYTTNGTAPKATSAKVLEGDVVLLTETCTLRTAVFNGSTQLASIEPVTLTFTRQAAHPVFTRVEEQSSSSAQAYTLTTTTPDGVIWVCQGDGGDWERLTEQPLMVTSSGVVYAKTIPESTVAMESEVSSVTVLQATMPTITAVCNGQPFTSGDVLDENESVVFTCAQPQANSTVMFSVNGGMWEPLSQVGLTVSSTAVARFRAEADEALASAIIEYEIGKATPGSRFTFMGDEALRNGWNLISFPVRLAKAHEQQFLSLAGRVFTLKNGQYAPVDAIEPGRAYFVHFDTASAAAKIFYHGMEADTAPELVNGWNMVGVVGVSDEATTAENAWLWNGKCFEQTTTLVPGRGYFILKEP